MWLGRGYCRSLLASGQSNGCSFHQLGRSESLGYDPSCLINVQFWKIPFLALITFGVGRRNFQKPFFSKKKKSGKILIWWKTPEKSGSTKNKILIKRRHLKFSDVLSLFQLKKKKREENRGKERKTRKKKHRLKRWKIQLRERR